MKRLIPTILIFGSLQVFANPVLDTLLIDIKKEQTHENQIADQREIEFKNKKDKQAELLLKAKKELALLEAKTNTLTKEFEANEKDLSKLESDLNIASGTLGEMFGVVKQTSGDLKSLFQTSIISAQIPGREKFVDDLASRKALPNMKELKELWYAILNEINESGKVTSFKTKSPPK